MGMIYVKKDKTRKRLVTEWSNIQSRVNQCCKISEHKIHL